MCTRRDCGLFVTATRRLMLGRCAALVLSVSALCQPIWVGAQPSDLDAADIDAAELCTASTSWPRAIASDDADTLKTLLRECAGTGIADQTSSIGKTALMVAAKLGDIELAESLLAAGVDIHAKTQTGGTAMMFAALGKDLVVAERLLASGAAVDDVGSNGWTALTVAAARGFSPMVAWLLVNEADAGSVDVYGYTPLMRAVENGHYDAAAALVRASDEAINHQDEFGNTALHHAAQAQREDLVGLLVEAGADGGIRNRAGQVADAVE